MNIADTLRGLIRRWKIVVPGLVLAFTVAIGTFFIIEPGYERTATQLLTPGTGIVPEGTTNPYLFLGGLTPATDILIRAVNSEDVIGEIASSYPGIEIEVKRDPTQSGPVLLLTVTAPSDQQAAAALTELLQRSAATLERLQVEQDVRTSDRINISTLTEDRQGAPQQRTRLVIAAGLGLVLIVLTLLVASLVDGLIRRATPRGRAGDQLPSNAAITHVPDDTAELDLVGLLEDFERAKLLGVDTTTDPAVEPSDSAAAAIKPHRRHRTTSATASTSPQDE